MHYNDIINGGNIPQGAVIQNDGSVLVQSKDGSVYLIGRVMVQGNSRTYHQDSSPTFIHQETLQQPTYAYGQPTNYQNQNRGVPPIVSQQYQQQGNAGSHVIGSSARSSRRGRREVRAEKEETKAPVNVSYPTISNDACPELHVSGSVVELEHVKTNISQYINGISYIRTELPFSASKKFITDILESESYMFVSENEEVDKWLIRNINVIGEEEGVKIFEPSDVGELKKVATHNESVSRLWKKFMELAFKVDESGIVVLYDLDHAVITNASGCTSELYDIRSLDEVAVPPESCVARLISRYKPNVIITPKFVFDVIGSKSVRIRSRL